MQRLRIFVASLAIIAAWSSAARTAEDGYPSRKKIKVKALTTNGFPEFIQPNIEWQLKRTFREHGGRPAKALAARYAYSVSGAGVAFMHEFRVNFPHARFRTCPITRTLYQYK